MSLWPESSCVELADNMPQQEQESRYGYQLGFVRLTNRFPTQQRFEIAPDLLTYISVQLQIDTALIEVYQRRQPTISQHQERIRNYLKLLKFDNTQREHLGQFIFPESCRLEQTGALWLLVEQFLRENRILRPASSTLERIIGEQRAAARRHIFEKMTSDLQMMWLRNSMPCF